VLGQVRLSRRSSSGTSRPRFFIARRPSGRF
jgi:hypothetical protein